MVASTLMAANADPARGGMANRVPVAAERQVLRRWGGADDCAVEDEPARRGAGLGKPPEDPSRGSQAEEVPGGGFKGGGNAPRASSGSRLTLGARTRVLERRLKSMSEYRRVQEILALSFARTWAEAKLKWESSEVYECRRRNVPLWALPNHSKCACSSIR